MSSTQPQAVVVEAEWALWGKDEDDTRDYHLLRCSSGALDQGTFKQQLTRYSPGTLDRLPQVSVSWIRRPSDGKASHLAIAFHETSESDPPGASARGRRDARGREITFVRYFCVRYEELARQAIGYEALYNGLLKVMVPAQDGPPINVEIQVQPVQMPPESRAVAQLIAAQLLTTRPVCLIGVGDTGAAVRLRFMDQIMSLLPYGARSCMSAATAVNSTYTRHRFRLFFASTPRSSTGGIPEYSGEKDLGGSGAQLPGDIIVDLSRVSHAPASLPVAAGSYASMYLDWARQAPPDAIAALARQVNPINLGIMTEVGRLIPELPIALSTRMPDMLAAIAQALDKQDASMLDSRLQHLRRQLTLPDAGIDRGQCRDLVKAHDLLRDSRGKGIPEPLQAELLDTLLSVAVDSPLTYQGFGQVGECARGNLHPALLRAAGKLRPANAFPVILIGNALRFADEQVFALLRHWELAPDEPLRALEADMLSRAREMPFPDSLAVYDAGLRYLLYVSEDPLEALRDLGFLAVVIDRLFPSWPEKVNYQRVVLNSVFGPRLNHGTVRELLVGPTFPRTAALARAVHTMTGNKGFTEQAFFDAVAPRVDEADIWQLPPSQRGPRRRGFLMRILLAPVALVAVLRKNGAELRASVGTGGQSGRRYMPSPLRAVGFVFLLLVLGAIAAIAFLELAVHH